MSGGHRRVGSGTTTIGLPGRSTLDGLAAAAAAADGLRLDDLEPLTALVVQTRNTRYRILVADGAEVVVQGGAYFPVATRARVDGSSLGSSVIKAGWIGIGLRMEICAGGRRIVTTEVRSIARDADAGGESAH